VGCVADGADVFLDQVLHRDDALSVSLSVDDAGEMAA
jgi:hypothetical protein